MTGFLHVFNPAMVSYVPLGVYSADTGGRAQQALFILERRFGLGIDFEGRAWRHRYINSAGR